MTTGIDPGQHLWWLASRSMGVVAMVLVSLSVAFGLALSGQASCADPAWRRGLQDDRTRRSR